MKAKKPKKKKEIILKSDKSFDELIEDAFEDKVFKKGEMKTIAFVAVPGKSNERKQKRTKRRTAVKKAAKKKK